MSKILIHSIVFSPDGVSTAYLYNDIAIKLKKSGHEVVVLTTTPHYNVIKSEEEKQPLKTKLFGLYYTSKFNDIKVIHIPQKKFKNSLLRIIGFIYWHIASFIIGLSEKKVEIILSPSPPLTIGLINILLGKIKSAKVIYNIQEIYPDLLIENGGLKSKTLICLLKYIEKTVYNNSDKITTIDQVFYNTIINRFKEKSKLEIIPNFVDTEIYKPIQKSRITIDRNLFPDNNSLKLMYAGNIGHAQEWDSLIRMAIELKNENIEFFIIGEGVMKEQLELKAISNNLTKVHILPYQPRELMPALIAYSDLQFIFMSPLTEGHGFPSKVYTIMACAKPMIVCSGAETPIVKFLEDKNCAFIINEQTIEVKVKKIIDILKSTTKIDLNKMGDNGLSCIQNNYSKEIVTEMYLRLINSLLQ